MKKPKIKFGEKPNAHLHPESLIGKFVHVAGMIAGIMLAAESGLDIDNDLVVAADENVHGHRVIQLRDVHGREDKFHANFFALDS